MSRRHLPPCGPWGLHWNLVMLLGRLPPGLTRDGIARFPQVAAAPTSPIPTTGRVILDNPAGLVNFSSQNFAEFGVDTVICKLRYTDPLNDRGASTQPMPIPELAYVYHDDERRWAAGLGVLPLPGRSFIPSYKTPSSARETTATVRSEPSPKSSCAVVPRDRQVVDRRHAGSRNQSRGTRLTILSANGSFGRHPGNLRLADGRRAMVWSVGLQYELTERRRLERRITAMRTSGCTGPLFSQVVVGPGPVLVPANFNARLAIGFPQTVGVGIKHAITDQHRVSADVIWYDWHSAFDHLGLRLTTGRIYVHCGVRPHDPRFGSAELVRQRLAAHRFTNSRRPTTTSFEPVTYTTPARSPAIP